MINADPRISRPTENSLQERLESCIEENRTLCATVFKIARVALAFIVPVIAFSCLSPLVAVAISIPTAAICLFPFIKKCCSNLRQASETFQRDAAVINQSRQQHYFNRSENVFTDPRTHHSRHPVFDERSARFPATSARHQSPAHAPLGSRHHEGAPSSRHDTFSHPRSEVFSPRSQEHIPVGTRSRASDGQPPAEAPSDVRAREDEMAFYPPPVAMRTYSHPSPAASAPRTALGSRAPRTEHQDLPVPAFEGDTPRTTAHVGVGSRRPTASS